ncbi:MAG TPA: PKD domain-containing protein, partial [Bacteroidia bacterium]|nr:PKD domain-containing protein [Bacteroidia bacterium]
MRKILTKISIALVVTAFMGFNSLRAQTYNITTIAGNGTSADLGDGGAATAAELYTPRITAIDGSGNIYILDEVNNVIRKINSSGIISKFAGNGTASYSGDGSAATAAGLNHPRGVAVDASGNVYIGDYGNNRIREVNYSTGIITTIAGNGTAGFSGDGGAATAAELNNPQGVAVDTYGNVYIADFINSVIRKVNTSGIISTIAGNTTMGYLGDGSAATAAELSGPVSVAIDASGNVYIGDYNNNVIRKVNTSGIISTIAGNHVAGYSGDGGAATAAQLFRPAGLAIDNSGNIYFADGGNSVIRKVNTSGIISTIAGNHVAGYSGDGGAATAAELQYPQGVAVDSSGNFYIADYNNNRIRKLTPLPVANFKGNTTVVCAGSTVQFTDTSSGNPTAWQWTFTGGTPSTSTVQNPLITYAT